YYLAKSGVMATGWGQIRGVWYFFDRTDGSMAASTSQTIDGKQYWFASSGAMRTDTWVKTAEGTPAFLGSNGVIAYSAQYDAQGRIVTADKTSGWKKIGWAWMYFDKAKNNSLQTGWFKVKGTWYYANSAGIMKTGWQKIGSSWYYLKSNGAMATGWLKLGSTWYYLDPSSGAMATGMRTISGKRYAFSNSGAWIQEGADMIARAQGFSSATPWLILVDTQTCHVGVFYGSQGHWELKHYWLCSAGAPGSETIKGEYTVGIRGPYFVAGGNLCHWYTQILGDYLFHSNLYYPDTGAEKDMRLGVNLSHGCVRLDIKNAKWIYDNIPQNTKVFIW
uniref:L,D-transpeptidase family protein n=1 Tax=Adlercreutzia agrestimuris TaxID=2941324 RepID=UPI002041A899